MTYVRVDNATARDVFERELKAATDLYGPNSPSLTPSLTSLGNIATMQKDYTTATNFYFRAVDLNEKQYGESSDRVANALVQATTPYFVQRDYEKAEPYLLRAVHIDQALFGKDSSSTLVPMSALCGLYDQWQKADKLAACDQQLIVILEKEYGASSPVLVQTLSGESGALRKIGRTQEADSVDQRVAQIRGATMKSP
jgi:tetratricopeptide (TPR) repeat protein